LLRRAPRIAVTEAARVARRPVNLTQQMVYVLLYAALLATRSWDRWSLDARRR
jgi:hypothetical protein